MANKKEALLIEAQEKDLLGLLQKSLSSTPYKQWSNMALLDVISSKYSFPENDNSRSILKKVFKCAWDSKINDEKISQPIKKRALKLKGVVDDSLNSRLADILINSNICEHAELGAKGRLTSKLYDSIGLPSNSTSKKRSISHGKENQSTDDTGKKQKKIMPKDFKGLHPYEQAQLLAQFCGKDNVLDFREPFIIPKRLETVTNTLIKELQIALQLKMKEEEYLLLNKISSSIDIFKLSNLISMNVRKDNAVLEYIQMSIYKLSILYKFGHLKQNHNECWYRVNVYSDTFDLLFLSTSLFESKRAECESVIIKLMKEKKLLPSTQKNCRLDFILESNSNDRFFEQLFCEDKPKEKESEIDIEKGDLVRTSTLRYWSTILPYEECMNYIESTSCHFNKLTLRIIGSKLIGGNILHYTKKETVIPNNKDNCTQLADYLGSVISVFRHVLLNLRKIKTICEIALQDDIKYLRSFTSPTFRQDTPDPESPSSSQSTEESIDSDEGSTIDWENVERKNRILKKIHKAMMAIDEENDSEFKDICWESLAFGSG